MNRQSAEERYRYDAAFHRLVDFMTDSYLNLQFTPSEMREAAVFAAIRAESITMSVVPLAQREGL